MYARGEGVARDRREAARWFRLAAGQGSSEAQVYLGLMYARGDGVERDRNEAAAWFRKAAEQGSARAKEYLKRLNENSSATL
jgi:TPR repeat protein